MGTPKEAKIIAFKKGDVWVLKASMSGEEIEVEVLHTDSIPEDRLKGAKIGIRHIKGRESSIIDAYLLRTVGSIKVSVGTK